MRTGTTDMPLHGGKAPAWLFNRMTALAREIAVYICGEFGPVHFLGLLSNPHWFQSFGCLLGFDWHSSGLTTTVCGALKEALRSTDIGFYIAGGKGSASRKTPEQIKKTCEKTGTDPYPLVKASRMAAKVDSAAVDDGYKLYHHVIAFTAGGKWCVIQQGMNEETRTARRYHWLSDACTSFVEEPHAAIHCSRLHEKVLNMVDRNSKASREKVVELTHIPTREVVSALRTWKTAAAPDSLWHLHMPSHHTIGFRDVDTAALERKMNALREADPADFEQLLGRPGVGLQTIRALALAAELIYGATPSFTDPARYSYAHGGKDGTPYPVRRDIYDTTIEIFRKALNAADIELSEKRRAFHRLARLETHAVASRERVR